MTTKKDNDITVVAIYIRVSSEEQAKHGYSLNSQKERLISYAKQNKYKVFKIYADEGKSARSNLKKRTALNELLSDGKDKKFNKIIFWRLDRWFRNIQDYYKVQEQLDKLNIGWECSDEEYNTTTSNGRLHLNIKLSIAQNESDQTSDRIKFNFENMVKNKKAITGKHRVPFGYTTQKVDTYSIVIIDESKREIVTEMFDYFKKYQSIRKTLIHINTTYNLKISYKTIRTSFRNTLYCGEYNGVNDYCEAYISKEQYLENQDIISKNYKGGTNKHEYIFSSLLICPKCGRRLKGSQNVYIRKSGEKVACYNYRCSKAHSDCLCINKKVTSENVIEKTLIEKIADVIEAESLKRSVEDNQKEITKKPVNKAKLQYKLNKLVDLYLDDKIDKDKYYKEHEVLTKEIEKAEKEVPEVKKRDLSEFNELKDNSYLEMYYKLDNEHKRLFWRKYIDKIIVNTSKYLDIFLK